MANLAGAQSGRFKQASLEFEAVQHFTALDALDEFFSRDGYRHLFYACMTVCALPLLSGLNIWAIRLVLPQPACP